MIDTEGFKKWLVENYTYSYAVVKDNVSRVRRADKLLEFSDDETYMFRLEQLNEYKKISVSVRSQIKKAVNLYQEYCGKSLNSI